MPGFIRKDASNDAVVSRGGGKRRIPPAGSRKQALVTEAQYFPSVGKRKSQFLSVSDQPLGIKHAVSKIDRLQHHLGEKFIFSRTQPQRGNFFQRKRSGQALRFRRVKIGTSSFLKFSKKGSISGFDLSAAT